VMSKANNLSGVLRVAAMDAAISFPSFVLFPHEKGACNSQDRAEVKRRLALWGAGEVESLATLARASMLMRAFTSGATTRPTSTQRAKALIHKGQFSRAAMLADSFGVAPASSEKYHALNLMHHAPGGFLYEDLVELFGEPKPVEATASAPNIGVDKVRECIAAALPVTSPHRDGWRMEHLEALARDHAFAATLATFISNIATRNVPSVTADYLTSATIVALLKKSEEDTQAFVAIVADPRLQCILPLYDMSNTYKEGELWFFDEEGNLTHNQASRRGVRQG